MSKEPVHAVHGSLNRVSPTFKIAFNCIEPEKADECSLTSVVQIRCGSLILVELGSSDGIFHDFDMSTPGRDHI